MDYHCIFSAFKQNVNFLFYFLTKDSGFFFTFNELFNIESSKRQFSSFLLVLIAPAVNSFFFFFFFFFFPFLFFFFFFFFNSCDVSSTWELFQPFGGSFNKLSLVFFINVLLKEVPLKTEIKKSIIFEIQIWIKQFLWQEYSIYGKKYNLKNNPCPVT